jgi:A/G-specific adenine glycosylase
MKLIKFRKEIWAYYKKSGRKMPWREEEDPYKVLVSEIMLQQTQVARVVTKYNEFLKVFPTIKKLSLANGHEVLKLWSGLGYNRRALNLQKLARILMQSYHGKIPQNKEELVSLPGIGDATAGAIRAFAFNFPEIFIETNIRRVYIHFFFPKSKKVSDNKIRTLVEKTLDRKNPRLWYYALMDYGAMLGQLKINPNTKSFSYRKQPKFKGSNREIRGAILRFLIEHNRKTPDEVNKNLKFDQRKFESALRSLLKEGIVKKKRELLLIA